VERSLPLAKVMDYYKQCPGTAKQVVLDYITFFEERKMVSDFLLAKQILLS